MAAEPEWRNHLKELVHAYNRATTEERAFFGVEALSSMLEAIEAIYGHRIENTKAHPLKIYRDENGKYHPRLNGEPVQNGEILDVLIGAPESWLSVWVEGLPNEFRACLYATYTVCNIQLAHDSIVRRPRHPPRDLQTLVHMRMKNLEESAAEESES